MQEEPARSERPGDQQPAAGEPAPPPPQPEGAPPPPPPHAGPGYPGAGAHPSPPGGPGYPGAGHPYPPPPEARRLTRRTDNRVIAGVASGLGTYFGIDPVIFRIGFVALTLAGGSGLLIYGLLWALLPAAPYDGPAGPPPAGPASGDPPIVAALRQGGAKSYLAIGAVILAVLLLAGSWAHPPVVFALLLIGVGVLLMRQDRPDQASGSSAPWPPRPPAGGGQQPGEHWQQGGAGPYAAAPPQGGAGPYAAAPPQGGQAPSGDFPRAAYGTATRPEARDDTRPGWDSPTGGSPAAEREWGAAGAPGAQVGWGSASSPSGMGAAPTSVAERRQRPRSILGWLTVAAALLAAGVASALDNFGVFDLTPARVVALMLTVVGIGLLVGSVWGRAWWLILLGLLLVPVMAVASVASDVPVRGRTGTQVEEPLTLTQVQPEYRLAAGQLTLDLRRVDFGPQQHTIKVGIGAGDLTVILPDDQPVTVRSRITAGEADVLGHPSNGGLQVDYTVSEDGTGSRLGRLTLDLRLGVGQIVVRRGP